MAGMLAAAGMMGGLALVLAELGKQQLSLEKKSASNLEVNALTQQIRRIIYDDAACRNTIGATTVLATGTTPTPVASVPLDSIRNKNGTEVFKKKSHPVDPDTTYGNDLIQIEQLLLRDIIISSGTIRTAEVNLRVIFEKTSRAITGYNRVIKDFPLSVELNATNNTPSRCYSDLQAAETIAKKQLCESLGGTYDDANGECPPPMASQCTNTTSVVGGFDNSGNVDNTACRALPGSLHPTGENCFLLTDFNMNRSEYRIYSSFQRRSDPRDVQFLGSRNDLGGGTIIDTNTTSCPNGYTERFFTPFVENSNNIFAGSTENGLLEKYCCR